MYPGNIYLLYIHTGAQADATRQRRFERSVEPFTMASVYPGKVRQLLAYQTFIIREGRWLGGNGWRSYDAMFWQQAALDPAVDWSKINSTLYAVAQPGMRVRSCSLCMESDHRQEDCSLQLATRTPKRVEVSAAAQGRQRFTCFAWNDRRCFHLACQYRHACSRCQGGHRLPKCRQMLATSPVSV